MFKMASKENFAVSVQLLGYLERREFQRLSTSVVHRHGHIDTKNKVHQLLRATCHCARTLRTCETAVPARAATSSRNGRSAVRYGGRPAPSASTKRAGQLTGDDEGDDGDRAGPGPLQPVAGARLDGLAVRALREVDEHRAALADGAVPRAGVVAALGGRRRPGLPQELGCDPDRGGVRSCPPRRHPRRSRTPPRWRRPREQAHRRGPAARCRGPTPSSSPARCPPAPRPGGPARDRGRHR